MKEGLRSGKLKVEKDKQVDVEKKGDELKQGGFDLGSEKNSYLVSSAVEEPEREFLCDRVKEKDEQGSVESGEDGDMREIENVGAAKIGKKICVDNGEEIDDGGIEKKKVKEKEVEKVQIVGRVTRSKSVVNGGCDKAESDGALVAKTKESKASHKKCTEVEDEGGDQLGEREIVGVFENGKKRKRVDNSQDINDDSLEKKKVKEEEAEKVQIVGRVTRSHSLVNGGCDKAESDGALVTKTREGDGAHKKCTEVEDEGGDHLGDREIVGAAEIGKKRKRVGSGQEINDDGLEKKRVKEEEVDGKVSSTVRVLRSRVVVNGGCDTAAIDGSFVGKSRARGFTKKLKGKVGRPPKVAKEESDRSSGGLKNKKLKRKRGRPKKVDNEKSDLLAGRLRNVSKVEHGRPFNVLETNVVGKGKLDMEGTSLSKSQERMQVNTITNGSSMERRSIGKEMDVKTSSAKSDKNGKDWETEVSEDAEGNKEGKQKGNKEQKTKQKDREGELARSRLKQLVRDKIVEQLDRAGWTIQHRPRIGREYKDAVYVSPAGKTHWSVTLAYRVLKKHCENGDDTSEVCKAGFKFTPLPPEEVEVLKRIVVKKRVGKKRANQKGKDGMEGENKAKKKKGKGRKTADGVIEEKRKKKLGRPLKVKGLLLEQDDSEGTGCNGMLSLVQDKEQHKTKNRKRCGLLVRNSENADSGNDGYIPYDGKRTVLAWMIDLGTLSLNSKVKYMNRRKTQVLLEGRITRDGIHCGCCSEIISISDFVTHAKHDYPEPFKHIYLDSGFSLLQCLLDSWNKQDEYERRGFHLVDVNREDPNDDTCGICGDGGDLICCDGCPSTFHQSCLEIKKFPSGEWHCVYCSCKFCGMFGGNRCQRDGNENIAAPALVTCHLCEEKYHPTCIQSKDNVNDDSRGPSFCGKSCQELFQNLQMLIGVRLRHEMEEGFSLTLIRRSDMSSNVSLCDAAQHGDCDSKLIECNSKLAVAFLIMDECFLPMVDHRSGVNLIHNILYNRGSNFNRLNYSGFFTAILERGDEIIAAASIRIHGNYLAEMPFIGTRYMYRRQGMCRRLLTAIENALCSLNVERLVIPAISELTETWTSVFGFKPLEESSKRKMKNMNILVFPGVDILQKPLLKQSTEGNTILMEGLRSTELEHHQIEQEVLCDTDERHLVASGSEATAPCGNEAIEFTADESDTQRHCGVSQDNVEGKSNTIIIPPQSLRDSYEQTEGVNEYPSCVSVPEVRAVEVDAQPNQHMTPEVESKSFTLHHIDSEANTESGVNKFTASTEGTETVDCEGRIEDGTVEILNSHSEGSICHSTEHNATEPHNMALVHEVQVSEQRIVCHDSETTSRASHDARDLKHHDSQHLQVSGKMSEICETENSHAATQHSPTVMAEVHPASIKCGGSKVPTETSKVSSDVFHPTSPSAHQKADDSTGLCTILEVGCSIGCSSGNGLDTDKLVLAPDHRSSHLSCGTTESLEVTDVDLTSNGSQKDTKSLKQSELNSQADDTSAAQCKTSNTHVVAVHCASDGGNSCGTSEVMVLSNQAS